jgi:fructose transport system permease protein
MTTQSVERRRKSDSRSVARRIFRHENATLVIILAALIAGMAIATGGKSAALRNMKMVLVETSTMGICAIGQAFVILTGGIDLSVAGIAFGTSALGSAMMTTQPFQQILGHAAPIWQGIPAMLALGAGLGAISGLVVSRIKVPGLIATLGVWQIAHGVGFFITGGFTITRMVAPLKFFGQGFIPEGGFPVAGIILIAVAVICYFVWHHTVYGQSVFATGGSPGTAYLSGVKVQRMQLSVYIISGLLAALGGTIRTARVMSVSYSSFDGLELQSIAAAVIGGMSLFGGKGNMVGVVLGALMIGVIRNGMSILGADPFLESTVLGVLVILFVGIDTWRRKGH